MGLNAATASPTSPARKTSHQPLLRLRTLPPSQAGIPQQTMALTRMTGQVLSTTSLRRATDPSLVVHAITQSGRSSHLSRRHPQEQHRLTCAVKIRLMALTVLYARMLSVPVCAGRRPTAREKAAGVAWSHAFLNTSCHECYQSI